MSYLDEIFFNHLTPDLLLPKYKNKNNRWAGFCYVVAEVLKSFDYDNQYRVMHMAHENISHWFLAKKDAKNLSLGTNIVDPTNKQFTTRIHYENAKGKGFLTSGLSKRAKILQNRINNSIKNSNSYKEANKEWGYKRILRSLQFDLLNSLELQSSNYALKLIVTEMENKIHEKTSNCS